MKIYVAGSYTPKNCDPHDAPVIAHRNVKKAIEVFWKLVEKGHYPYLPHLTHFVHLETPEKAPPLSQDFWYKFDLEWLKCCDAIFMMPGWETSKGARLEHEAAKKLGLKIYYSIDEVPEAKKEMNNLLIIWRYEDGGLHFAYLDARSLDEVENSMMFKAVKSTKPEWIIIAEEKKVIHLEDEKK